MCNRKFNEWIDYPDLFMQKPSPEWSEEKLEEIYEELVDICRKFTVSGYKDPADSIDIKDELKKLEEEDV